MQPLLLARAKALAVAGDAAGQLVLGADQTLARGVTRFNKPANRAGAAEQLQALRGQTHELHPRLLWRKTTRCCSIASTPRG
ncbi:MAG: Maf family protein [Pseudolabrys sp.]